MTDRELEVLSHLLELLGNRKHDPGRRTSVSRPAVSVLARTVPTAPSKEDRSDWLEYERLLSLCIEDDVILMAEDQINMLLSLEADLREDLAREYVLEQQWDRYIASGGAEIEAGLHSSAESDGSEIDAGRDRYRSEWARYTGQKETDSDQV